jgi:hypothetical protein
MALCVEVVPLLNLIVLMDATETSVKQGYFISDYAQLQEHIAEIFTVDNYCAGSCEPRSRCRPNECIWIWETPGGRDFGMRGI